MALNIETGGGSPDANSFATAAELVVFAGDYGFSVPADEAGQESLLRRAGVQMKAMQWVGTQLHDEQGLPWPRYYTIRRDFMADGVSLPRDIKLGQMALACEIHADDLDPPEGRTGAVTKERVEGAVEVQYSAIQGYKSKAVSGRQSSGFFARFSLAPYNTRLERA